MKKNSVMGKILYLGTDSDFFNQLEIFFTLVSDQIFCKEETYSPAKVIQKCTSSIVDMVYVDFSDDTLDVASIIKETIFLKRIAQYRSVLFVAIFKNELQKNDHVNLFTSGFLLSHIKGTEADSVFRDSYYIGFRQKIDFPVLALARNINQDLRVGLCSTLTSMSKSEFRVETDIDGVEGQLSLTLTMFPDLKCNSFEIKPHQKVSNTFPMTSSYTLAYPFSGPWEDDTEFTIQPETVETWLSSFEQEFETVSNVRIKIISTDVSFMNDIFCQKDLSAMIEAGDEINTIEEELLLSRPSLIFLNLDDEADGRINLSLLEFLFSPGFSGSEYNPIIVVNNSASSGTALQKVYNYPMIVASTPKLDADLILTLMRKMQAKKQNTGIDEFPSFKAHSMYRQIDVCHLFTITSLTEHEVTFFSDIELPMFTLLHFHLPLEFHATVVPPTQGLESRASRKHYMAFIHGLSEEQLMVLRKFINQIIYTPLPDFSLETIKRMREVATAALITEVPKTIEELPKETKKMQQVSDDKYMFAGKSKL